jgi:hypothetical protein
LHILLSNMISASFHTDTDTSAVLDTISVAEQVLLELPAIDERINLVLLMGSVVLILIFILSLKIYQLEYDKIKEGDKS